MLADALRLSLRRGAGPFRSAAHLGVEPRAYASLAVRQSLGAEHGAEALARAANDSPFSSLLAVAGEQSSGRTGLERWWLPKTGKPVSVSFDWRFSLRSKRKEDMLEELLYYRLALGQPNPEAFVEMLKRVGADHGNPRDLAIDLSAISRPRLRTA